MESQSLVTYIEKIRYGRNISQEKMLSDIISVRQYRRYLYGEIEIPFGVFAQLADRLNIAPRKLFNEYEQDKYKIEKLVISYYNAVASSNVKQAEEYAEQINENDIIDETHKNFYKSASILLKLHQGKITKLESINLHKRLIDYPNILKNDVFTDTEIYLLGTISVYDSTCRDDIMKKIEKLYEDDQLQVASDNVLMKTQILFWLAKYNGIKKRFDKVVEYCNLGIKLNHQYNQSYLLLYFYYYNALSYYHTNEIDEYESSLYQTILHLELDESKELLKKFTEKINRDFNIEPLTFLREYVKKKQNL